MSSHYDFEPRGQKGRSGMSATMRALLAGVCLLPLMPALALAQQGEPETELPQVVVRPTGPVVVRADASPYAKWNFTPAGNGQVSAAQAAGETLFTSDTATLLRQVPGGAAWGAGGVSSLPAVNGMGGAGRVQVSINDTLFGMACPNDMNPALSYVNPAMVAGMQVYMGTAPVSVGGDYTGAKVDVQMAPPRFTTGQALVTSGSISGFYRSNGNSYGVDANATVSNEDTSLTYTGGWARASDYRSGDGTTIKSTMYETQNHALSLSKKLNDQIFTFQIGGQFIPSQGYVNEYMDMVDNKSIFANGRYEGQFDWGLLEAAVFATRVRHTMGFIAPDKTGDMPMDTRATDMGYNIKASINTSAQDIVRIGNETVYNHLDDWWPPVAGSMMMGPNTFQTINNGKRVRVGTFAEWERQINAQWTALLGVRNDTVWMNTGDVEGYNQMMYGADAALFNSRNHARTDVNFDGTALVRYTPDDASTYELAFARKTRSPSFYERYAWSTNGMAMRMIGWFGDGNGYVGNLDLDPEAAHTASFTATWQDPVAQKWELRVSPYYSYVVDYIDVDRCTAAGCLASNAQNATTTESFVYLRFANHDAWLYGVNIDGKLALWESAELGAGTLRGNLNYVQGRRTDGVNLYHMMPLNGTLALDHRLGRWSSSLELQMVAAKTRVSEVHNELETSGYALLNFRTGYEWDQLKVELGVDNIFDTEYDLPLGGANLVNYRNTAGRALWGYGVAGPGRSFNGRVTMKF